MCTSVSDKCVTNYISVLLWDLLCSVVFLVAPLIFYDFMFVLHKQTSPSLLWSPIYWTPPQLILVSNKLKPNPNHLGYILFFSQSNETPHPAPVDQNGKPQTGVGFV